MASDVGRRSPRSAGFGKGLTFCDPLISRSSVFGFTLRPAMASRDDEDEDDYLTMTFDHVAPSTPAAETYSQRRARKLREHDDQSHIKPAKVLEQERREEGLAQNLFVESAAKETKAMRMMKLMGYTYRLWETLLISVRGRRWEAGIQAVVLSPLPWKYQKARPLASYRRRPLICRPKRNWSRK